MARQTHHIESRINGELEPVARGELAPGILVATEAAFNLPALWREGNFGEKPGPCQHVAQSKLNPDSSPTG